MWQPCLCLIMSHVTALICLIMSHVAALFMLGMARSVCQVFKYRIYVCPLHPRSVACSFADLEGFTIPSSFPQPTPPFMHFSLHTSPSTPSVTSLTITGSSQLQNGCGLELPNTARIRRIYGITEFGLGGGRLESTAYIPYRIIRIIIRIRIWPTLIIILYPAA